MIKNALALAVLMVFLTMLTFGMNVEIGGDPFVFGPPGPLPPRPITPPPAFPMNLFKITDVTFIEPLSDNFSVIEKFSAFFNSTINATPFISSLGGVVGARVTSNSIEHTFLSPFKIFAEVDGGALLANAEFFPLVNADAGFLFELYKNMSTYFEIEYCTSFSDKIIFQNQFLRILPNNFFIMGGIDWRF